MELEGKGVEISILLCTEDFQEIESKNILLRPDRVLQSMVKAILKKGKLGVIVPSLDQIQATKMKWDSTGFSVVVGAISPYTGTEKEKIEIANKYKHLKVDLIILDCIGFNRMTKAVFRCNKKACAPTKDNIRKNCERTQRSNNKIPMPRLEESSQKLVEILRRLDIGGNPRALYGFAQCFLQSIWS